MAFNLSPLLIKGGGFNSDDESDDDNKNYDDGNYDDDHQYKKREKSHWF